MENILNDISEKIGLTGRMISGSKSMYYNTFPDNLIVFNANIFIKGSLFKKGEKIWFGDLDLTQDSNKLIEIANKYNTVLYVLKEMDGRFNSDNNKKFKKVAIWNTKTGLRYDYKNLYHEHNLTYINK
jgi:hypothetical protein